MKSYVGQLTYKQLTTLVSRFQTSMHRLKKSGDYPEVDEDKKLLEILINLKYDAGKREGR